MPFDMKASVSATPDGLIRIHSESIKGFGVPVNPLLKVLRVQTDDLFTIDPGHGVRVDGNDLLLDREAAAAARVARQAHGRARRHGALVQIFGSGDGTADLAIGDGEESHLLARRPARVRQADDDGNGSRTGG